MRSLLKIPNSVILCYMRVDMYPVAPITCMKLKVYHVYWIWNILLTVHRLSFSLVFFSPHLCSKGSWFPQQSIMYVCIYLYTQWFHKFPNMYYLVLRIVYSLSKFLLIKRKLSETCIFLMQLHGRCVRIVSISSLSYKVQWHVFASRVFIFL